jgi:CMP/dCMP kinase
VIDRVVTITGPPGSGKSTAGRSLADRLRLDYRSAGDLFRERARTTGLSLEAFSRLAETDESIDRALDDRMLAMAGAGRLLDGRVAGALCRRRGIPCHYLVVTARPEVRYARLASRDHVAYAEAAATTVAREESERDRYRRYYGIDLDSEPSDLTLDSSETPAPQVVDRMAEFLLAQAPSERR